MKLCKKCNEVLSEEQFHNDKGRPDGLSFYCKECNKARSRKNKIIEKGNITCRICKAKFKSYKSLANHIKMSHDDITSQIYYDKYIKKKNECKCLICKNKTAYIGLRLGYKKFCSSKCGTIYQQKTMTLSDKKTMYNKSKLKYRMKSREEKVKIKQKELETKRKNGTLSIKYSKASQELFWELYELLAPQFSRIHFAELGSINDGKNREFRVGRRMLDFYIEGINVCIEYLGDFWHKNSDSEDLKRHYELLEKKPNLKIFYIKEKENNKVQKCMNFIGSVMGKRRFYKESLKLLNIIENNRKKFRIRMSRNLKHDKNMCHI